MLLVTACSNPNEFRFGANPIEDMKKNDATMKQLPASDLALLSKYVVFMGKRKGKQQPHPASGKTIKQVLQDAKAWQAARAADPSILDDEDTKLLAATEEDKREFLRTKIAQMVSVSFIKRVLLPPNPAANRNDPVIQLQYQVVNRTDRAIVTLKGKAVYIGEFDDLIVEHPIQNTKVIPVGGNIIVTSGYLVSPVWPQMSKLAAVPDGKFTFTFVPETLILEDGETLNVPPDRQRASR